MINPSTSGSLVVWPEDWVQIHPWESQSHARSVSWHPEGRKRTRRKGQIESECANAFKPQIFTQIIIHKAARTTFISASFERVWVAGEGRGWRWRPGSQWDGAAARVRVPAGAAFSAWMHEGHISFPKQLASRLEPAVWRRCCHFISRRPGLGSTNAPLHGPLRLTSARRVAGMDTSGSSWYGDIGWPWNELSPLQPGFRHPQV